MHRVETDNKKKQAPYFFNLTQISAPCLMDYGAYFTKISAPCFLDYGAYIYKNQCTLFYGLWCVYLPKSVHPGHPVFWIRCVYLKKSVHPVLWITERIFLSWRCHVSSRYNVSLRGVNFLTDRFIIATFSPPERWIRWWLAGEHPISHFTLFLMFLKGLSHQISIA